jgi:hypothetical protein
MTPYRCASFLENLSRDPEPKSATPVFLCSQFVQIREVTFMSSKLALSALIVASLLGATMTIASAQMQPAPGASSQDNVGRGATAHRTKMKTHKMSASKTRSGTTTGMSAGSRKGNREGTGTNNNSMDR